MIDHVLGRPSVKSRRLQVLAVLAFWTAYLLKGNKNGPPIVRFFSKCLSRRLTFWQTLTITMLYLYSARNFSTLVGLASPDPLANMYDATYFRATWILTALDAGFWTAMPIKTKWLRDAASIVFSLFYMVAAEKADEKVRKVRGNITVDHLRVSWNKGVESPYLRTLQGLVRPRMTKWPPRQVRIPRPSTSDYKEPVEGWLYFDGPLSELKEQGHNQLVLDIPGGGFVAMDPRCNDDKLFAWAAKTGLPILSLDYKKAPEYPFPYALNECYDVYCTLIRSKGRCVGMSGEQVPRVVITGDSAGGTLATAMTIMITESGSSPIRRFQGQTDLPIPEALVLFYPALDMNIGSWMSDEQMALIKDRRMRGTNKRVLQRKTMQYNDLVGTPHQSDDEDDGTPDNNTNNNDNNNNSSSNLAPEEVASISSTTSDLDHSSSIHESSSSSASEPEDDDNDYPPSIKRVPHCRPCTSVILQSLPRVAKRTLFLLPDGGGSASSYVPLPRLKSDVAVVGLNCPYARDPENMNCTHTAMIESFCAEIRRRQPHGPYHLGGWSSGGAFAYVVAEALVNSGEEVGSIIIIDAPVPQVMEKLPDSFYKHCNSVGLFANQPGGQGGSTEPPGYLIPHFQAVVDVMLDYKVAPLKAISGRMPKVGLIWAAETVLKESEAPKMKGMHFMVKKRVDFGPDGWDGVLPGAEFDIVKAEGANHFTLMSKEHVGLISDLIDRVMSGYTG